MNERFYWNRFGWVQTLDWKCPWVGSNTGLCPNWQHCPIDNFGDHCFGYVVNIGYGLLCIATTSEVQIQKSIFNRIVLGAYCHNSLTPWLDCGKMTIRRVVWELTYWRENEGILKLSHGHVSGCGQSVTNRTGSDKKWVTHRVMIGRSVSHTVTWRRTTWNLLINLLWTTANQLRNYVFRYIRVSDNLSIINWYCVPLWFLKPVYDQLWPTRGHM